MMSVRSSFHTDCLVSAMLMSPPDALLNTIAQSLLETLDVSVLSDAVIEASPEFADSIWKSWDAHADYVQKCRDLHALACIGEEELDDVIDAVVHGLGLSARGEQTEGVIGYLQMLPGTIRRHFRRPSNPLGTKLPQDLPLYGSWDLLPLLPARMPKFQSGDRPWGIGDWELRELTELGPFGEVWKAVNPRVRERAPVSLRFFTSPAATRHLREKAASVLDRVTLLGRVPGIVPLQEIHLFADPPCVQYPYLQAADLVSLVLEWREMGASINPYEVSDLIYQIAQTVGGLHALPSPIVHGNLQGANILLMTDATGRRRCLLANLGLGAWVGGTVTPGSTPGSTLSAGCHSDPSRDDPPEVRDDVYALGVLWYQLLAGDLSRPRPGGSSWRRRLVARGMPSALVELLESCFDDEADARPADCGSLAEAIGHGLGDAFVV